MKKTVLMLAAAALMLCGCDKAGTPCPTVMPTAALKPTPEITYTAIESTASSDETFYLNEFDTDISGFEKLLPDEYRGALRLSDGNSTFAFKCTDGGLFTVNIDTTVSDSIAVGHCMMMNTGEGAYLALWRINREYTVSVSGSGVSEDEMKEFLNIFGE